MDFAGKSAHVKPQQFASDNYSGMCSEATTYLIRANEYHETAYGTDPWTAAVCDRVRDLFEIDCEVYFVFNGTAANSLALSALCRSYHSIICHELAHIETDECGAPEFFSNGSKILLGSGSGGKLNPGVIEKLVTKRADIHYPKPKVVSVTQATEVGTVYQPRELLDIRNVCDKHVLRIHMDGARFANAAAYLDVSPKEITWQCGVDVLCLGGTKNGLAFGELVVFFDHEMAKDFDYQCKQAGQLASKMRFLSAPWLGLLEKDVWLKNASTANTMAQRLARGLSDIEGLSVMFPVEANSVFVELPERATRFLKEQGWVFYTFIGAGGVRFMCSWDTSEESVDTLLADVKRGLDGQDDED